MRYTIGTERERTLRPVLIFEGTAVGDIAKDKTLRELFPAGYVIKTSAVGQDLSRANPWVSSPPPPKLTLISTTLDVYIPDRATLVTPPVHLYMNGVAHTINLRDRYNQCLSLFKATGCFQCPDKGPRCLSESLGLEPPLEVFEWVDADTLCERLEKEQPLLAGASFVPPSHTKISTFQKKVRPYWQHDFNEIETNCELRSQASTDAAETKRFKKTECAKCLIKNSCERARSCSGAFPPEIEIIGASEQHLTEALAKSAWPEWQLWEAARFMGETAKHSRWHIMLTGLKLQGTDGIVATVHRAKGSIDHYKLTTYEDIAKVFKLALTEDEALSKGRGPVKDPKLRAILWLTLKTGRGYQSYGWGNSRYITGVGANDSYVSVKWTNGNYLSYGDELREIAHVASCLSSGRLADIDNVSIR